MKNVQEAKVLLQGFQDWVRGTPEGQRCWMLRTNGNSLEMCNVNSTLQVHHMISALNLDELAMAAAGNALLVHRNTPYHTGSYRVFATYILYLLAQNHEYNACETFVYLMLAPTLRHKGDTTWP
jgi:hypothetical protein